MRPLIIVAVAVVALAAAALARLGQTLEQLGAIEAPSLPPAALSAVVDAGTAAMPSDPAQSQLATPPPAAVAASSGDEHILRALAQNPDFMRAAEELLQDPDPQAQQEARQLLRELGALDER